MECGVACLESVSWNSSVGFEEVVRGGGVGETTSSRH